jgi:hypothetical protein
MKKAAKTFGDVDLDLAYAPECEGMPRAGAPTQGVAIETIPPIAPALAKPPAAMKGIPSLYGRWSPKPQVFTRHFLLHRQ